MDFLNKKKVSGAIIELVNMYIWEREREMKNEIAKQQQYQHSLVKHLLYKKSNQIKINNKKCWIENG